MSATPRLAFPYVLQSQSQKEVTVNSTFNRLDALVQAAVEDMDLAVPPDSPGEGSLWVVAAVATGAWSARENSLAHFIGGAWAFYEPSEGMSVWVKDDGLPARWSGSAWEVGALAADSVWIGGQQVVGARAAAIANVSGGATQDGEARSVINTVLAALRSHGLIES